MQYPLREKIGNPGLVTDQQREVQASVCTLNGEVIYWELPKMKNLKRRITCNFTTEFTFYCLL